MTGEIAFTKVRLPYGWLGNMAPSPIWHQGQRWRTSEALFQALRFNDRAIREEIRGEASPMAAKFVAKREREMMVVVPQSDLDVANMEMVLRLKLEQHRELREMLRDTSDAPLIEDCSRRPRGSALFWGAAWKAGTWTGENVVGRIWMKVREEIRGLVPVAIIG